MATVEQASIHDFGWYRQHLKIQDRASHRLIPLQPTGIQQQVRDAILLAEKERRPGRLIILKARREGVSTIVQATFAHRAFTRNHVKAYTIADEADSAQNLHGMTEIMWEHLPKALQPAKGYGSGSGRRLRLASGSDMRTETAQDKHAGRSGAATLVHASEFAFWPYPEETLTAMLQIVPDEVGTCVVIESTAYGVGNAFHEEWLRANRKGRVGGYTPLFFSWLVDPGYWKPTTEAQLGELDDIEEELAEVHSASLGQLAWRRHKISQDLQNKPEKFRQEYPATPEEAFLATGRQFFGAAQINRFKPVEAIGRFRLDGVWKKGTGPKRDPNGPLWIYKLPEEGHRYLLFVDPAGVVSDMEAKHFTVTEDVEDFTCMWVVDCTDMSTVAVWHQRIDIGLAGEEAARLGLVYKKAILCAETSGGYGFVLTAKWRELGYAPLHRDRLRNQYDRSAKPVYGFATSVATRPIMLETLRDVLRETPWLLCHDGLKDEMRTFVTTKTIPAAAPGCHDDQVMAAAGCYLVAQDYAKRRPIEAEWKKKPKSTYRDVLMRTRTKRPA